MKYLICGLCFLMLVGCGATVDFTKEREITSIEVYPSGSYYYIGGSSGISMCKKIKAGHDFAKIGDIVMYKDGVIKVVKKKKKK